jgi:hypothetical protein
MLLMRNRGTGSESISDSRSVGGAGGTSNPRPMRCELDARQKRKCLPFPQLQPPKKNPRVLTFSTFLTIAYASCAVIFGQVLASWNPKTLGFKLSSALLRLLSAIVRGCTSIPPSNASVHSRLIIDALRHSSINPSASLSRGFRLSVRV